MAPEMKTGIPLRENAGRGSLLDHITVLRYYKGFTKPFLEHYTIFFNHQLVNNAVSLSMAYCLCEMNQNNLLPHVSYILVGHGRLTSLYRQAPEIKVLLMDR